MNTFVHVTVLLESLHATTGLHMPAAMQKFCYPELSMQIVIREGDSCQLSEVWAYELISQAWTQLEAFGQKLWNYRTLHSPWFTHCGLI